MSEAEAGPWGARHGVQVPGPGSALEEEVGVPGWVQRPVQPLLQRAFGPKAAHCSRVVLFVRGAFASSCQVNIIGYSVASFGGGGSLLSRWR